MDQFDHISFPTLLLGSKAVRVQQHMSTCNAQNLLSCFKGFLNVLPSKKHGYGVWCLDPGKIVDRVKL